jgi:YaiO family outer membrane protein
MRKVILYLLLVVLVAGAKMAQAQAASDSLLNLALQQAQNRDYENAIKSLNILLDEWSVQYQQKEFERISDSILSLAKIESDKKNYMEAIQQVNKVLKIWDLRQVPVTTVNTDSIFQVAIDLAKEKKYDKSIETAKTVLGHHPDRVDVLVFIANDFAWNSEFDSAKVYINKAYKKDPKNQELYDSWLNILLWNAEYEEVIRKADLAEDHKYTNKDNLTLKRLYAYNNLDRYDSAAALFDNGKNQKLLDSAAINSLYEDVLIKSKKNIVSGYYTVDFFQGNDPTPHHLAYVDYGTKINRNTLIFRLNYANRYNLNGALIEADYYHLLSGKRYFYFNYGFAVTKDLFPRHRAGIEYYFPLPNKFEGSIGARYIYFTNTGVFILTGHLAKSIDKKWFALRPFISFEQSGNYISLIGQARLIGHNPFVYWGVELAYGNSPDDRYFLDPAGTYFNLNAYRIKFEKSVMITKTDDLKFALGFAYEEYQKDLFRQRYTLEITYKLRF